MQILIEALQKIAKIPCQCNCGNLHFEDCTQTIAKKALEAAQQSMHPTPRGRAGSAGSRVRNSKNVLPAKSG